MTLRVAANLLLVVIGLSVVFCDENSPDGILKTFQKMITESEIITNRLEESGDRSANGGYASAEETDERSGGRYVEDEDSGRNGRFLNYNASNNELFGIIRQSVGPNAFDILKKQYRKVTPLSEYDFIIVGSGSAGSVIANRLSEIPEWKILLLEAGKGEMILTDVPALAPNFQQTDYNWGYKMERQPGVCLGMVDQLCNFPRGKAIGGTTVINYMIYTRGNRIDYDRWAAMGNDGWSYKDVLPYFLKSENANLRDLQGSPYHKKGGYLSVEDVPFRTPLIDAFIEGGRELGYDLVDYNGAQQIGVSYTQANTIRGRRHSAASAFLDPVQHRPNLHILQSSRVTRVLIDPKTRQAYGVEYVRNKRIQVVRARKEVVLSAGAFNSPQLLMLSGVGPIDHLQELGIPVLQDLPVGQTMYDHISVVGLTFLINSSVSLVQSRYMNLPTVLQWINGRGALTSLGGVEGLSYIKTRLSNATGDYPDVELIFLGGSLNSDDGVAVRTGIAITDELYNAVYRPINNKDTWGVFPMLLHPKSKGYLRLKSRNPFHWPLLYGNYFTDPNGEDLETLVEAIKEILKFSQTTAMQRFGSRLHDIPLPGCKHLTFGSDYYWRCMIRQLSGTLHHQIGTCKMGPSSDPEAVVDPNLRVYGIARLRVADTSIIPDSPGAHTNAPSIMIGEKASDMIKDTWIDDYSTLIDERARF